MIAHAKAFLLRHSFPRFAFVGGIGFLVDAGLMSALLYGLGVDVVYARLLSFACALTTTWLLNREFTFRHAKSPDRLREWLRYAAVAMTAGAVNLAVFFTLARAASPPLSLPLVALVIATLVALSVNYFGSRAWVFGGGDASRHARGRPPW